MPTTPDPIHESHLEQLREQATTIGEQLAHAEYGAAARLLWQAHPGAARLLFAHEDLDVLSMVPLVLLAADDTVLWFLDDANQYDCRNYPGASKVSTDQGRCRTTLEVYGAVVDHLERGYQAHGGIYGAVDTADPGHFGYEYGQPLQLDVAAALNPYQPRPDHGFICKKCGGPSPMGVGYVADGRAAGSLSQNLTRCACGHSQRTTTPDTPR